MLFGGWTTSRLQGKTESYATRKSYLHVLNLGPKSPGSYDLFKPIG